MNIHSWFCNIITCSFEKYCLLRCTPRVLIYCIALHSRKKCICNITTNFITKVFKLKKFQAHCGGCKVPKSLIFAWKLKFYHWQQVLSSFLWHDKFILCVVEKMSTQYPNLNNLTLSPLLFKNDVLWKVTSSAHSSNNHTVLSL